MELPSLMLKLFLIGCGGFLGSVSRYLVGSLTHFLARTHYFPIGTLAVNVLGCLAIGCIGGFLEARESINASWASFLLVGFLGGFTTFSTFGYESFRLLREGQNGLLLANILLNVVLGLLAVAAGLTLSRLAP